MATRVFEVTCQTLASIDAFADLDETARTAIARSCSGVRFRAGDTVVNHRDEGTEVFFVHSGRIRVTIFSPTGREVTFRDQEAGEMFGELSAIDKLARSAEVLALTDAALIMMSGDEFRRLTEQFPSLATFTLKRLAALVRSLSVRVYELSALAVRARVHAELIRLSREVSADGQTATLDPAPKHQEIASRIGTTREAVAREMKELANEGILTRRGSVIEVLNIDALVERLTQSGGDA